MALEYKKVLCPIEFDDSNFLVALRTGAEAVSGTEGTLFVLTAFPEVVHEPAGTKLFAEVNQAQENYAGSRMAEVERKQLVGIKHELLVMLNKTTLKGKWQYRCGSTKSTVVETLSLSVKCGFI